MLALDLRISLASVLKSATGVAHEELETALHPQLAGMRHRSDYAQLLATFYGFFAPVERAIEAQLVSDELPDLHERRKATWMLDDIAELGEATLPPESPFLPVIDTPSAAFGALYVLEGSTLGGRQISKMIHKALPDAPLRFFEGYGRDTGPRWVAFQEALNAWGERHEHQAVIDAANQTFKTFRLWINDSL